MLVKHLFCLASMHFLLINNILCFFFRCFYIYNIFYSFYCLTLSSIFQVILLLKYVERYSLMKCHSLPREPSSLDGEGTTSSDLKK
jgi:hypothetical protein